IKHNEEEMKLRKHYNEIIDKLENDKKNNENVIKEFEEKLAKLVSKQKDEKDSLASAYQKKILELSKLNEQESLELVRKDEDLKNEQNKQNNAIEEKDKEITRLKEEVSKWKSLYENLSKNLTIKNKDH